MPYWRGLPPSRLFRYEHAPLVRDGTITTITNVPHAAEQPMHATLLAQPVT
jgi:hypothetical protein